MKEFTQIAENLEYLISWYESGMDMVKILRRGMEGTDAPAKNCMKALALGWAHLAEVSESIERLTNQFFDNVLMLREGAA